LWRAIELMDGAIITDRTFARMHAASSLLLNALKRLADFPDRIHENGLRRLGINLTGDANFSSKNLLIRSAFMNEKNVICCCDLAFGRIMCYFNGE